MILYDFVFSEDRDRVVEQGPLAVRRAALNLKSWDPELTLSEFSFKDCAFWVQIHDLPPNRMNMNNATKLGKFIGKFIKVDMETMEQQVKRFMKIFKFNMKR